MNQNIFFRILQGKFKLKELRGYLLIITILFFIPLFISLSLYPKELEYSVMKDMVSYLGSWDKNPRGYQFFNFSFIFLGFAYFPLIQYLHRRISVPRCKWFAICGTIFLILSAIGIIGIGFFPDADGKNLFGIEGRKIHFDFAYLAVIGFLAGMICYIEIIVEDYIAMLRNKQNYFDFKKFKIPIIYFLLFFIGLIATQIYAKNHFVRPYPGFFSKSMWEWTIFMSSFFEMYSFSILLPNHIPVEIDYKNYILGLIKDDKNLLESSIEVSPP